ncbi:MULTISPECIES: VOC family protein [Haloferacaceae]|uniref:VOC family protein n=1 Tax=Halorubrum glutamatedens TaxID=2707018 RepID=A0ABD5QRP6_9EURY|nr:VOC family protein [Halobellus captivus]
MTHTLETPGIHHVTAIAGDPNANHAFYTETLGLRLVKRSVNQDDVGVYHLFYADDAGNPGTSMTFFPYVGARSGRVGDGQASTVSFTIPAASVDYWVDRLADRGLDVETTERFGDAVVGFEDPDGLPLELVAREDAPAGDPPTGPVPDEHAIRGFFAVELSLSDPNATVELLEAMGYEETDGDEAGHRRRFEADGDRGFVVDVVTDPATPQGAPGAGTVHHVAYRVTDEEQEEWRTLLQEHGLRPSEVIDRKWFRSVYARTRGGVLFEFATAEPGYDVDEPRSSLGERLVLPDWLEDRREEIESGLPELETTPPAME